MTTLYSVVGYEPIQEKVTHHIASSKDEMFRKLNEAYKMTRDEFKNLIDPEVKTTTVYVTVDVGYGSTVQRRIDLVIDSTEF